MMLKGRIEVSSALRPSVADMEKHAIPALAPELATQAWFKVVDRATLIGSSPRVSAGWPTMVSLVESIESIVNIETVFEPGYDCNQVLHESVMKLMILAKAKPTLPATLTTP